MGLSINQDVFTEADFLQFRRRLDENLIALRQILSRPGFGEVDDERKIGCEVELYLLDENGRPIHCNAEILKAVGDKNLTLELNRYNLEYNLTPVQLNDQPFTRMSSELESAIRAINGAGKPRQCRALPIGILPTITEEDFGYHVMTDERRYHALTRELRALRGGPFHIDIQGIDKLNASMEDVTLEGANTSLQMHYQVNPKDFADTYNALQLITPLTVALSANSPFVFGHRLWHETRIPLFKQSIDCRRYDPLHPQPARVNFGHSWVRKGAFELFTEAVRLYRPLLPICSQLKDDALQPPPLHELRLQQGSVWLWNRPVYDPAGDGHLRIEARALPAGPTLKDMMANMVLTIGLIEVMRPRMNALLPSMPFEYCARNFYRAAECGLDVDIIWPNETQMEPEYRTCRDILTELISDVPEALDKLNMCPKEYLPSIEILKRRIATGQTGAVWQLSTYQQLVSEMTHEDALKEMVRQYRKNSENNMPVSEWEAV